MNDDVMSDDWLKGCEICDAGFCAEMDKFTNEHNMSQRTAAEELAETIEKKLGFQLYSPDALRKRYQRHTGKLGRNVPRTKSNSKTAPRTSSTVGTAGMTTPKQRRGPNTDTLLKLKDHAQALAEGLKQLGDGKIKSLPGSEAKVFEGIKEAVIVIIAQAKKLGIEIEK
jgi:hypothetical protein